MQTINVAFYKFVNFAEDELPALRQSLKARCLELGLKGTILLSEEGINAFLAGTRDAIEQIKTHVLAIPGVDPVDFKESPSTDKPFTRMLVKIKKEIITMGVPEIKPASFTGPRVSAREFKQWLDQGREVVVLDTRNDYETRIGTFKNAVDLDLKTFRQFPEKVKGLPEDIKNKTIVSFCTGGIRCEKASAYLISQGFKDVYQLDGGILKYFEEVGGSHYDGECFVFDYRVAVDPTLNETDTVLCYNCQSPVTRQEQQSGLYVANRSCPHCHAGKPIAHKERIAKELKERRQADAC